MNKKKPNVILVITDDQGYGDLGCGGNKNIHTPNIDKFSKESCNLDDFHVAPLCAPTRGELMSGCCALRNGVWATCWGRSIMSIKHKSMAESFSESGYATGMFGKWHLGDNYPYRPQDRGFQRVVAHKGGGVGQTPDFWGNNYFDDTYFKNGEPTNYNGYCTDVWFDQAKSFISENVDKPFFAYIATNAPHSPYLVDEKYAKHYRDNDNIVSPEFYGMIENIDENFGNLRNTLKKLNIEDNTILIFMTDNGSSGCGEFDKEENLTRGFNSNMRGMKGSFYEGGHRVPFIIHWKDGDLNIEKHIKDTCYGVDIFPTLSQICNLDVPKDLDGISFSDCILEDKKRDSGRIQVIQYEQKTTTPNKTNVTLSKDNFRLVKGKELYDIEKDPSQKNNIADKNKTLVHELLSFYDKWWDKNIEEAKKYIPIYLGDKSENPCRLDAMDVLGDVAWNQMQVQKAVRSSGIWSVSIRQSGKYKVTLKRWPIEEKELKGTPIAPYVPWQKQIKMADIKTGHLILNNNKYETNWDNKKEECEFLLDIEQNDYTTLKAGFTLEDGEYFGAYYVYVERLN